MYTDMYNTFENESIPYSFPFSFQSNKLDYMKGNLPTYEMDFGDTVTLPFYIEDKYKDYQINLFIYNYRFEEIYSESFTVDNENKICFVVNSELSESLFKKGRYFCKLQAAYANEFYEDVCTLINPKDCVIYVR